MRLSALCFLMLRAADPALAGVVDDYVRAEMLRSKVPGVSILVRRGGAGCG